MDVWPGALGASRLGPLHSLWTCYKDCRNAVERKFSRGKRAIDSFAFLQSNPSQLPLSLCPSAHVQMLRPAVSHMWTLAFIYQETELNPNPLIYPVLTHFSLSPELLYCESCSLWQMFSDTGVLEPSGWPVLQC